jgi:hypothetical protein
LLPGSDDDAGAGAAAAVDAAVADAAAVAVTEAADATTERLLLSRTYNSTTAVATVLPVPSAPLPPSATAAAASPVAVSSAVAAAVAAAVATAVPADAAAAWLERRRVARLFDALDTLAATARPVTAVDVPWAAAEDAAGAGNGAVGRLGAHAPLGAGVAGAFVARFAAAYEAEAGAMAKTGRLEVPRVQFLPAVRQEHSFYSVARGKVAAASVAAPAEVEMRMFIAVENDGSLRLAYTYD